MSNLTLNARVRTEVGKGASRRLRRLAGEIPAIVYGVGEPINIALAHKDIIHELNNEEFYSQIIKLNIDGKKQEVILKDLQRHPAKKAIYHADFLRVDYSKELHTSVPLHFLNEEQCIGVKQQGGIVTHTAIELEITCLPKDLPPHIEVDLLEVEVGTVLHISDIKLPEGVSSVALLHGDLPIVAVNTAKIAVEDEVEEGTETEDESETESEE